MYKYEFTQKLSAEIDAYLVLMPNAALYRVCRQQETKKILIHVIEALQLLEVENHVLLDELDHDLRLIMKWDGVKEEPTEIEFKIVIGKVRDDLDSVKKYCQAYTRIESNGKPEQSNNRLFG